MRKPFVTFFAVGLLCSSATSAENLLVGADIGFGEYLSGECVTCHSQTGVNNGIRQSTVWTRKSLLLFCMPTKLAI